MKLHVCNGCGAEKMLDERVRHWHDCHPAKFAFMVKSDKQLAAQLVRAVDCAYCHCSTAIVRDGVHCINCGLVYKSHSH